MPDILIKDWYGVDEDDFMNLRPAALLDERHCCLGAATLRGYKPFINVYYRYDLKLYSNAKIIVYLSFSRMYFDVKIMNLLNLSMFIRLWF
ncbi:hypothetical protein CS542_09915 [Pedobacter sp. IW39]|nr:hypothetical protein CS542_09915 [Pedobacter sp. IW39]